MSESVVFDSVNFGWVPANEVKSWSFAEIHDASGEIVVVEFQNARPEDGRDKIFAEFISKLKSVSVNRDTEVEGLLGLTRDEAKANSRVVSALCTAVVELQCRYSGESMTEALGGERKGRQLLYANLNRYLRDVKRSRTPTAFGEAAEGAAREGFTILKTDPFDEVRPTHSADEILNVAAISLERLAVMLSAAGPDVALQVDCHGAFNVETASIIAPELEKLGVTWFEDPVNHRPKVEGLRMVRERVNIPLAAGGDDYGEEIFAEMVEAGVSYTMQDVMRCGGVGVAARAGQAAIEHGVHISCHSPFGPLSNLASAHVHAATPNPHALEHALWENDWRADLLDPPELVEKGHLTFPGGVGMGATINWKTLERAGGRRWKV
jgi:L-alanine-DL-glutamate epimerase-like enolase superfamily enzyme